MFRSIFFVTSCGVWTVMAKGSVMPWMCLEVCDETPEIIQKELDAFKNNLDIVDKVSFERYTLEDKSALVEFDYVSDVTQSLLSMGIKPYPMVSSWPHDPAFIDWLRTCMADPDPFIDSLIQEAEEHQYTGFNIDFEPDYANADDGNKYPVFLQYVYERLAEKGVDMNVDVATWSPIWNYTAISETSLTKIITMGTYTSSDSSYSSQLQKAVDAFDSSRTGVGLLSYNASTGLEEDLSAIEWRIDEARNANCTEIDIWQAPVPDDWWPLLRDFVNSVN